MLTNPTIEKLKELKLSGMSKAFEEQLHSTDYAQLSFEERIGIMVEREITERENRHLSVRLRQAKLRHQACMEDIDYQIHRGLDKSLLKQLALCGWIKDKLNILITGPCGVGKSFIACALGHKACLTGYRVFYTRSSRLFQDIAVAKGDGRYASLMKNLAKTNVLIIDDWGLSGLTEQERMDMLEIIEDRNNLQSTIITSQLPVKDWHETIGNPTLADAILDRLVHNAYTINLDGHSLRKKNAKAKTA